MARAALGTEIVTERTFCDDWSVLVCPECGESYPVGQACARDGARLADNTQDPLLGQSVGSYRIAARIGAGGMGEVYRAVQPSIGSRVAIKVIGHDWSEQSTLVERFFQEARAVNLIRHESIVNVLDLAWLPDGRPYIVMEYLDGRSLARLMGDKGRLPLGAAVRLLREVTDGLAAAHDQGIVHRDLKPDNLWVTPAGRVKILDFGLAKLAEHASGGAPLTTTGTILGTPYYMAPEQVVGGAIDARTDVYALGVVLFEVCTGRVPFVGSTMFEVLKQHIEVLPPRPEKFRPDLPGALGELILRALEKDPARRFQTMRELGRALDGAKRSLSSDTVPLVIEASGARPAPTPLPTAAIEKVERSVPATVSARGAGATVASAAYPVASPAPPATGAASSPSAWGTGSNWGPGSAVAGQSAMSPPEYSRPSWGSGAVPGAYESAPRRGAGPSGLVLFALFGAVGLLAIVLAGIVGWGLYRWIVSLAESQSRESTGEQTTQQDSGPSGVSPKSSPVTSKPLRWASQSIKFVRVSGGAVPDIVGQGYWQSGSELAVFQGATGKVIWHHPIDSSGEEYADGQDGLLLATSSNALIRYAAQNGDQRWKIQIAEYISDITFGPGCASLMLTKTKDPVGVSLATGAAQACPGAPPGEYRRIRLEPKDAHLNHGAWTIESSIQRDPKPINPDPPRVVVRASQGGRELFRQASLPIEPIGNTDGQFALVADSDAGVFVFGRSAAGKTAWGLIELPSGRVVYSRVGTAQAKWDNGAPAITGAKSMVFVQHDWTLEAYEAKTGRLVWTASEG